MDPVGGGEREHVGASKAGRAPGLPPERGDDDGVVGSGRRAEEGGPPVQRERLFTSPPPRQFVGDHEAEVGLDRRLPTEVVREPVAHLDQGGASADALA